MITGSRKVSIRRSHLAASSSSFYHNRTLSKASWGVPARCACSKTALVTHCTNCRKRAVRATKSVSQFTCSQIIHAYWESRKKTKQIEFFQGHNFGLSKYTTAGNVNPEDVSSFTKVSRRNLTTHLFVVQRRSKHLMETNAEELRVRFAVS